MIAKTPTSHRPHLHRIASPEPASGTAKAAGKSTLTIGTYNILFKTTLKQNREDLARLIKQTGVINLQEFTPEHNKLFAWLKEQGWGHYHAPHTGEPVIWDKRKYELVAAGTKKLNDAVDNLGPTHRHYTAHRATWVRLRDKRTGKVFTTVSVHTIAHNRGPKKTPRTDAIERHQFRELAELTAKLKKHGPVIIGGDLNSTPRHAATWPKKILRSAHLRSNWSELGMKGVGEGTHGRRFIDHFLTLTTMRDRLKLLKHRIVYGLHSDHNAVIGKYRLK
ncbi:MAG: endonuclease/exonuclease/phosphatase family protein [Myxococcaceae bacterium]|nr:endonuclease/exonuclease/phosphatase family protein [Myxococcaceae bacterium]